MTVEELKDYLEEQLNDAEVLLTAPDHNYWPARVVSGKARKYVEQHPYGFGEHYDDAPHDVQNYEIVDMVLIVP